MDNNGDDNNNSVTQWNIKYKTQRTDHTLHCLSMYCLIPPHLSSMLSKVEETVQAKTWRREISAVQASNQM